jgi:osmotically-inducible protein OsmY
MMSNLSGSVKERVEAKLRNDAQTRDFPIEVISSNGVIILQGEVPTEAISMTAEGLARQVEGVVNVMNELNIQNPAQRHITVPPIAGAPGSPQTR